MKPPKIICIDGLIGAGKSTILEKLKKKGYYVFKENLDEWGYFLDLFYKNKPRWAFTLQIAILNNLLKQHVEMLQIDAEFIFVERSPTSSMIFGKNSHLRGYISDEEFKVYQDYSDKFIWYPDLTIFIDTPLKTCINRINTRGRECESTIEKNYLIQLEVEYK